VSTVEVIVNDGCPATKVAGDFGNSRGPAAVGLRLASCIGYGWSVVPSSHSFLDNFLLADHTGVDAISVNASPFIEGFRGSPSSLQ
jgi:hypothetical protein